MFSSALILLLATLACAEDKNGVLVGHLKTFQHDTKGDVYAIDEKTIVVKKFTYDGTAPDAFFWVGKSSNKPNLDGTILPHPFTGKFFEYSDKNSPKLTGVYDGTKDITLTLPENLNVSDLKWFSVWCREFEVILGELIFPANFSFDKIVFPGAVSHDDNDLDDGHEPHAEAEAEAEPHGHSAGSLTSSSIVLLFAVLLINKIFN